MIVSSTPSGRTSGSAADVSKFRLQNWNGTVCFPNFSAVRTDTLIYDWYHERCFSTVQFGFKEFQRNAKQSPGQFLT